MGPEPEKLDDYYPCELCFECVSCGSRNTVEAESRENEPEKCYVCGSDDISCIDHRPHQR